MGRPLKLCNLKEDSIFHRFIYRSSLVWLVENAIELGTRVSSDSSRLEVRGWKQVDLVRHLVSRNQYVCSSTRD